jgi:hypothetical protein
MKSYFGVLWQATTAVAARHGGLQAALACEGFFTDLIPGIVMGAVFAQMSLLAQPLCLALGQENHAGGEVEELLVAAPPGFDFGSADGRLRGGARQVAAGLHVLRVPTFKPLTEVLLALAQAPGVALLLISTHATVHVKVLAQAGEAAQGGALAALQAGRLPGVAPLYTFALPHVGGGALPATQASLAVEVPALLALLRYCHAHHLQRQVYDFN